MASAAARRGHTAGSCLRPKARRGLAVAAAAPGTVMREVLRRQDRWVVGGGHTHHGHKRVVACGLSLQHNTPYRLKMDVDDDRQFYSAPRLVKHVDDRFLAQVTQLYRERIPPGRTLTVNSLWQRSRPSKHLTSQSCTSVCLGA